MRDNDMTKRLWGHEWSKSSFICGSYHIAWITKTSVSISLLLLLKTNEIQYENMNFCVFISELLMLK